MRGPLLRGSSVFKKLKNSLLAVSSGFGNWDPQVQTSDRLEMLLRQFEQRPAFATMYLRRVQDSKAKDSLEDLFPLFAAVLMTSSDRDQIQLALDLMTKAGVAHIGYVPMESRPFLVNSGATFTSCKDSK